MKKWIAAALAAIGTVGSANAAVMTLDSVAAFGSDFKFTYEGTLGPDEGVKAGDRLIIFDFAGYVAGSIDGGSPSVIGSTELFSATPFIIPGQTDDPTISNLVFTYTGPDFQTSGGPFPAFSFGGLSAVSMFSGTRLDAFTTFTTKNNPPPTAGTDLVQVGETQVPMSAAVPEPATWMMMLLGFGLAGRSLRSRRRGLQLA